LPIRFPCKQLQGSHELHFWQYDVADSHPREVLGITDII
jgi:hypothetical protein